MFVLFHVPSFHGTNAGTLGQADVYLLPGGGGDFMHVLKKHNALIGDSY